MPSASIAGFPAILKLKMFQPSDARPGKIVVECIVAGTTLPRYSTLTITGPSFSGVWPEVRIVSVARVERSRMRIVLEDNRWRLRDTYVGENYNDRDSLGNVMTRNRKSCSELVQELATAAGLSINAGSLPGFYPPAKWANVRTMDAMNDFLQNTGSRMVYNTSTQQYTISSAGTGSVTGNRRWRPAPVSTPSTVRVYSGPILYEDTLACTAKRINQSSGAAENLAATVTLPTDFQDAHAFTTLRLWQPNSISTPSGASVSDCLFVNHRAKSEIFDPENQTFQRGRVIPDDMPIWPVHGQFVTPPNEIIKVIETTSGQCLVTDQPVLMRFGGSKAYAKNCDMLTAYYARLNGDFYRSHYDVNVGGSGGTINLLRPWIKPVVSSEPDMSGSVWNTVLSAAAGAVAGLYTGPASTVSFVSPVPTNGSPAVGAAMYEYDVTRRRKLWGSYAINFTPGGMGMIR